MIFDLHGQTLVGGIKRGPFGDSPRFEHTLHLQPKIVVKPRSAVPLHYKAMPLALVELRWRFRCVAETPFPFVFFEGHKGILNRRAGEQVAWAEGSASWTYSWNIEWLFVVQYSGASFVFCEHPS